MLEIYLKLCMIATKLNLKSSDYYLYYKCIAQILRTSKVFRSFTFITHTYIHYVETIIQALDYGTISPWRWANSVEHFEYHLKSYLFTKTFY